MSIFYLKFNFKLANLKVIHILLLIYYPYTKLTVFFAYEGRPAQPIKGHLRCGVLPVPEPDAAPALGPSGSCPGRRVVNQVRCVVVRRAGVGTVLAGRDAFPGIFQRGCAGDAGKRRVEVAAAGRLSAQLGVVADGLLERLRQGPTDFLRSGAEDRSGYC